MRDIVAPFRVISNLEVCWCIGTSVAVLSLLSALGHQGLGVAGGAMVGVLVSCMGICWPLRHRSWFWITAMALAVLHIIALFRVDWSFARSWTGLTIMPLMAADTFATLIVVYVVFRLVEGAPDRLFVPDDSSPQGYADRADF